MHSHLAIIGKSGPLAMKPDSSVTITEKNPMFNDVEMFSHDFPLPLDGNRHLVQNLENVNSKMRAVDMEGERLQIVIDGVPMRSAVLKVQEDARVTDSIDVNLDATNRTFKDMIQDLRCRDVSVDDDILIGEKIGDVSLHVEYETVWRQRIQVDRQSPGDPSDPSDQWTHEIGTTEITQKAEVIDGTFQPPALGFSYPAKCITKEDGIEAVPSQDSLTIDGQHITTPQVDELYINTKTPYGAGDEHGKRWPYCNSRICYAHHDKKNSGETDEDGNLVYETDDALVPNGAATPDDKHNFGPYWVLDANRPASGICFYVAYFLERLFKDLGMAYDMSALTNIEDFNYLCFFNTACKYSTENTQLELDNIEDINRWLSSRGCGGQLSIDYNNLDKEVLLNTIDQSSDDYHKYLTLTAEEVKSCDNAVVLENVPYTPSYYIKMDNDDGSVGPLVTWNQWPCRYEGWTYHLDRTYSVSSVRNQQVSACVQEMYATNDNYPDVNVSEVIESLENTFGVRFCYDIEQNKVTVRLLRDMFRQQQAPVKLKGTVLSMVKHTEKITGVRAGYAAESDLQEQRDNIRYQKKDYDTTYDYMEYPQGRTLLAPYGTITKLVDIGNMNCYVDLATGNAYRIKIDADAKTVGEMKPSLFEVGGLKGAEIGDCSKENDDYVREYRSQFEPIICNVLKRDQNGSILLAPFVDEDMEHELLPMTVQNVMVVGRSEVFFNYNMKLLENYDPTGTDDGQSPLMSHEWGLTVGILRPGAGSEEPYEFDEDYDGFGNSRWGISAEDYAVTADSYDVRGRFMGTSPAGSFSLKPCAYKPFRYKYVSGQLKISTNPKEWDDSWLIPCDDDMRNADGTIAARIRSRGTTDTFMAEFFRFLLDRQRYEVEALCTAAELADIPNKWLRLWEIDGKIGFINTVEYAVDVQKGVGKTKIDFFAM